MGGYLEAPAPRNHTQPRKWTKIDPIDCDSTQLCSIKGGIEFETDPSREHYRLIHPTEINSVKSKDTKTQKKRKLNVTQDKTVNTLRLAEDTRFFYAHLHAGGKLHLHRTPSPLVSYRHRLGMSQSSGTPRKLLLRLRAKAWEDTIFHGEGSSTKWTDGFAIWGAGRDGKDFLKALSLEAVSKVMCFVDVDKKKIEQIRWYDNPALGGMRIPILHFSVLSKTAVGEPASFGRIEKKKCEEDDFQVIPNCRSQTSEITVKPKNVNSRKKNKSNVLIDPEILQQLPVVICVAMYRTNGALESNVASIGRTEGEDLWHVI